MKGPATLALVDFAVKPLFIMDATSASRAEEYRAHVRLFNMPQYAFFKT
jgi:hypothetical protein